MSLLLFSLSSLIMKPVKVVAIVGMSGAGKSEVSRVFERSGFTRIRFGDLTDEEMKRRGFKPNEENERQVRELLRKEHGMAAYAKLNLPKIEEALKKSSIVIDGLYSWEEYIYLKERYGKDLYLVAVWASPSTRYARLSRRSSRRLSLEEAISRDRTELENTNKGGPIAMADFTIINEFSVEVLRKETKRIITALRWKNRKG